MDNKQVVVLCIIFIVIIVYISMKPCIKPNSLIPGFWEADSSFCSEASLKAMSIFIGDEDLFGERPCYILVIGDDDDIIVNEPASVKITAIDNNIDPRHCCATFTKLEKEATKNFPVDQKIDHFIKCNKMILYKDDTVFAVLYKNPVLSELMSTEAFIKSKGVKYNNESNGQVANANDGGDDGDGDDVE
jgi:hypothetical protein